MPDIEISNEMLWQTRCQLSLAPIAEAMLWPHDPDQRREARRTVIAQVAAEVFESDGHFAPDDIARLPELLRHAADSMPLQWMKHSASQPFLHGTIAGELLLLAISRYQIGGEIKLQSVKLEIIDCCVLRSKNNSSFDISMSTLENTIWKRYKPVSHLWAAYINRLLYEQNGTFPCQVGDIGNFLGTAEHLRRIAESIPLARRAGTLLCPGEQWTLPAGVVVPTIGLEFLPVDCSKSD